MKTPRKIHRLFKSKPVVEGAGVHLKRAMGFNEVGMFDPFLLLDDFRSDTPTRYLKGFPWHPHRGIETITYMLRGNIEHGDSMGNQGEITPGDVQWMTAGSGIVHQEMPKGDARGRMEGFQLWANLPAAQKMTAPRYRHIKSSRIPIVHLENGVDIKIISGQVNSVQGPVQDIIIDPEYLDVSIPARTIYHHPTRPGHTVFAYVVAGSGYFGEKKPEFAEGVDTPHDPNLKNETLLLFHDGDHVSVKTGKETVRFLFIAGRPLNEPVAWQGPIVMNSREELEIAFKEYREGTFIKHRS